MGRKGSWFSAVKKAFSPHSKKDQRNHKSEKKWLGKHKESDLDLSYEEAPINVAPPVPRTEDLKLTKVGDEQNKHAYSVALASAVAAEAAVAAAAQAAAEVVRLTSVPHYTGNSRKEIAAIKIQTAFRGYLARRALRALRGLVRLKTLIQGQSVKRQAASTLRCMQTLARLQSQIRARRIRMSEENQALQQHLQQKCKKELEKLQFSQIGEEWDDSLQSKEQLEAKMLNRHEAAIRRERALAYAFSHQQTWKNPSKSVNPTFMDPNNPHWGWSWLERWMAMRPWESRSIMDQNEHASVKSAARHAMSGGEITKLYSLRHNKPSPTGQKLSRPLSCQSPAKFPSLSSGIGKARPPTPKGSTWRGDDDSRSLFSVQSEHNRRHSIAGSSVRDDASLASSPAFPSYMAPTKSAKTRSKMQSPLGVDRIGTPDKVSVFSAKKRLSFPASPASSRRHSGPPKLEMISTKGGTTVTD